MKHPFTHTVLRYVHDTTTGEFINVGVAIYSREARYASALCRNTLGRLSKTFPGMDGEAFKSLMRYIQSRMEELGDGLQNDLPFEGLPESVMELAHQVLPPDDSSLQWSPPGSGLSDDLPRTLESLFQRHVMRYEDRPQQERRTDDEVWRKFRRTLEARHVLKHLQPKKITGRDDEIEFQHAWKNGLWHCLEPVSFDLSSPDSIREKAHRWLGQVMSVHDADEPFKLYLLLGEPQQEVLRPAFEKAISILGNLPVENEIIREPDAEGFSARFAGEIEAHSHGA
jgi:hypothetical protein